MAPWIPLTRSHCLEEASVSDPQDETIDMGRNGAADRAARVAQTGVPGFARGGSGSISAYLHGRRDRYRGILRGRCRRRTWTCHPSSARPALGLRE